MEDKYTNEIIAINKRTGEVSEVVNYMLPRGSVYWTPESQRIYAEKKERDRKAMLNRQLNNPLGRFYSALASEDFSDLSPETTTRLLYLNTYVGYDKGKLMLTERTPMLRKDLSKILGVSKATCSRFLKEVSPKYITEKEGLLYSNCDIFKKGTVYKKGKKYKPYQRIYIEGVRSLYQNTRTSNHKHLGYLFKLLPFINFEYNILCKNPDEKELDKVQTISLSDFCDMTGFDIKHYDRLLEIYRNTSFTIGNKSERFCAVVSDGINILNARIFINPHILYCGSNYKKVEVLGTFCNKKSNL